MADTKKLGFMIKDLKAMKQILMPKDEEDPEVQKELQNMDKFQSKKHELNKHLKNLRENINRLTEYRKNAKTKERDGHQIKLTHENNTGLTKAGQLFGELRRALDENYKKDGKKLGERLLHDRKKQVELLGDEIKSLVALNSTHLSVEDVVIHDTGDTARSRSRTQRKREERKTRQENRKARRAGRGKAGINIDEDAFEDAHPMSQQEQQFMDQVTANKDEQNVMIDEIGKAMDELHELSLDMNKQLTIQNDLVTEVESKIDDVMDKMVSANVQLKQMLDSNGGMTRWCPMLCFLVVLLALIGYMFKLTG